MPRIAAEYSDEVRKLNKKEEILLQKKIKIFNKQEKAAETTHKQNLHDVERLKKSISRDKKMPDLEDIDRWKRHSKSGTYGTVPTEKPKLGNQFSMMKQVMAFSKADEKKKKRTMKLPPLSKKFHNQKGPDTIPVNSVQPGTSFPAVSKSSASPRFRSVHKKRTDRTVLMQHSVASQERNFLDQMHTGKDFSTPIPSVNAISSVNTFLPKTILRKEARVRIEAMEQIVGEQQAEAEEEAQEIPTECIGDPRAMTEEWVESSVKLLNSSRNSARSLSDVDSGHCSR